MKIRQARKIIRAHHRPRPRETTRAKAFARYLQWLRKKWVKWGRP